MRRGSTGIRVARLAMVISAMSAGGTVIGLASTAVAPGVAGAITLPEIFVGSSHSATASSIRSFQAGATGNVAPLATTTSTEVGTSAALAFDPTTGDLWVADTQEDQIDAYSALQVGVGGTQTPVVAIANLAGPDGLAFDAAGDLWVAQQKSNSVVEYAANQLSTSGAFAPAVTLSSTGGASPSFHQPAGLAFDALGNLWVSNSYFTFDHATGSSLVEISRSDLGASGAPPTAVVISPDATAEIAVPFGIAFSPTGWLWVSNYTNESLAGFAPSQLRASGAPVPATTLTPTSTPSGTGWQIAFGPTGRLFEAMTTSSGVAVWSPAELAKGGKEAPVQFITGLATGLAAPSGLALNPAPLLYSVSAVSGPPAGGNRVTIHGANFATGATVRFGTKAATTVDVMSPSQLTAVAPAGSGVVAVSVSTGLGTSTAVPGAQYTYAAGGSRAYVGQLTGAEVDGYAIPATGNVKPTTVEATGIGGTNAYGVTVDAYGNLWVAVDGKSELAEYSPAQRKVDGAPTVVIGGALLGPVGLAFDGYGDLWVANINDDQLLEYTPTELGVSGTPVPAVTITSLSGSLVFPAEIAFAPDGDLWVTTADDTAVGYSPSQLATGGALAPTASISAGPAGGVAFDALGDLWVSDLVHNTIEEFSAAQLSSGGSPLPVVSLTTVPGPWALGFDDAGDLWVASRSNALDGFAPATLATSAKSPTPTWSIKGSTTRMDVPAGLAIAAPPTVSSVAPFNGPSGGGTSVTVTGSGYTSDTAVWFGTTPASTVDVVSPFDLTALAPAGANTVHVRVTTYAGTSATSFKDLYSYPAGYDLVGTDGGVFVFNPPGVSGGFYGSLPGLGDVPNKPVVGIVPTETDQGYFLVAQDGGVFAFGTAPFLGSLPGLGVTPTLPIRGIVATDTDRGYYLVGQDGGVFAFGTAPFLGSLPGDGITLSDIIGIAATPSGNGYWVVAATGKVYGFGAAQAFPTQPTTSAVTAIAGTPTGGGYWLVTTLGGVYPYGTAAKKGTGTLPAIGVKPNLPVIGLVPTTGTTGYWLLGSDGGIFAFGAAPFDGSLPGLKISVTNIVGAVPN